MLNLDQYLNLLVPAVREASAAILNIYKTDFSVTLKEDKSPVTEADKNSSAIICEHLGKTEIPVISEEETKLAYDLRKDGPVWLVDPLDGTKEFIRKNDEFCIIITHIENQKPVFGLIADVVGGKLLFGSPTHGSFIADYDLVNKERLGSISVPKDELVLINSRSHLHPKSQSLLQSFNDEGLVTSVKQKGSALKFFDMVTGKVQLYPRMGTTMEWDIAAGQAIFEGVGGEVLNFATFESLVYNKEDLRNPAFIAKPKNLKLDFLK